MYQSEKILQQRATERGAVPRHMIDEPHSESSSIKHMSSSSRSTARSRADIPEDPRLKARPPEPSEQTLLPKKSKDKNTEKVKKKKRAQ